MASLWIFLSHLGNRFLLQPWRCPFLLAWLESPIWASPPFPLFQISLSLSLVCLCVCVFWFETQWIWLLYFDLSCLVTEKVREKLRWTFWLSTIVSLCIQENDKHFDWSGDYIMFCFASAFSNFLYCFIIVLFACEFWIGIWNSLYYLYFSFINQRQLEIWNWWK